MYTAPDQTSAPAHFTGKGREFGRLRASVPKLLGFRRSLLRFRAMLAEKKPLSTGKKTIASFRPSGNVAWGCCQESQPNSAAKVVTISRPRTDMSMIPTGIQWRKDRLYARTPRQAANDNPLAPYAEKNIPNATFFPGKKPCGAEVDIAPIPAPLRTSSPEADVQRSSSITASSWLP